MGNKIETGYKTSKKDKFINDLKLWGATVLLAGTIGTGIWFQVQYEEAEDLQKFIEKAGSTAEQIMEDDQNFALYQVFHKGRDKWFITYRRPEGGFESQFVKFNNKEFISSLPENIQEDVATKTTIENGYF